MDVVISLSWLFFVIFPIIKKKKAEITIERVTTQLLTSDTSASFEKPNLKCNSNVWKSTKALKSYGETGLENI